MARAALAAGAAHTSPRRSVPATHLVAAYRVRMRSTAAKGIAAVGLAEAVSALDAAGAASVAIGDIGGPSDRWHFTVFIDLDSGSLLACTGVERTAV